MLKEYGMHRINNFDIIYFYSYILKKNFGYKNNKYIEVIRCIKPKDIEC